MPESIHSSRRVHLGGGRAAGIGDFQIRAAQDEGLDEVVEDDPIGTAWPVASPRVGVNVGWDQRDELAPQGFHDEG